MSNFKNDKSILDEEELVSPFQLISKDTIEGGNKHKLWQTQLESPFMEVSLPKEELDKEDSLNEDELNHIDFENDVGGEWTASQLTTALKLNSELMKADSLNWGSYLPQIEQLLKTKLGMCIGIINGILQPAVFHFDIDKYQEKKVLDRKILVPRYRGVIDLPTWSEMQRDYHYNLRNTYHIPIKHAIALNKIEQTKRDWAKHRAKIIELLTTQKPPILKPDFPLDDTNFALAVAMFQGLSPLFKDLKKDGVIGYHTIRALYSPEGVGSGLSGELDVKYKDFEKASAEEIAGEYGSILLRMKLISNGVFEDLRDPLHIKPEFRSWIKKSFAGLAAVASIIGAIAGAFSIGGLALVTAVEAGAFSIGGILFQDYDNDRIQKAADDFNLTVMAMLSGLRDTTIIQLPGPYEITKFVARQIDIDKILFLKFMRKLDELSTNPTELTKQILLTIFISFNVKCKLIVYVPNDKLIDEWDGTNIEKYIRDWAQLKIEFFKGLPSTFFFGGTERLDSYNEGTLKSLWNFWKQKKYTIRELTEFLSSTVFFRCRFILLKAFDVFVKNIEGSEKSEIFKNGWIDIDYIDINNVYRSLGFDKLPFINPTTQQKFELSFQATNKAGLSYVNQIILRIVNAIMKRDFNGTTDHKDVSYVLQEVESSGNNYEYSLQQFESGETDYHDHYYSDEDNLLDKPTSYETDFVNDETEIEYDVQASPSITQPTKPASDLSIAVTIFEKPQQQKIDTNLLSPLKNSKAIKLNTDLLKKIKIDSLHVLTNLQRYVDLNVIRQAIDAYNKAYPSTPIAAGTSPVDAIFSEAVHQFQVANFLHPESQDGVLGQSTLDTLGFTNHGLRHKLDSSGFYGQKQLNRSEIKSQIPVLTNNEFTSANWYQFILKPSWLGVKITNGIHLLLLRKLREAEAWLLKQPQYQGMTPAALGKALGFTESTRYSGARLSANKQAMHGFGLALDINVSGNPWIGAGWVKNDKVLLLERTRMIKALRNAARDNSLPGKNVFAYLDSIAASAGTDTSKAYSILKLRNDQFIAYLKNNPSELSYWKRSQTFGNRNPLNGFLNLHPDLLYALRQVAGLAWGAIDFGPNASGDIMHFDFRTLGVGKIIAKYIHGYVPQSGHPAITKETENDELEYHEAIEEAEWDNDNEMNYEEVELENDNEMDFEAVEEDV